MASITTTSDTWRPIATNTEWVLSPKDITIGGELGRGTFGVYGTAADYETKEELIRNGPSAPPSNENDIIPLLDGNGDPLDLRNPSNARSQWCSCLSCCWKPSLKKYVFWGLVDIVYMILIGMILLGAPNPLPEADAFFPCFIEELEPDVVSPSASNTSNTFSPSSSTLSIDACINANINHLNMIILAFITIAQPMVFFFAYRHANMARSQSNDPHARITTPYTYSKYDRIICDIGFSSWICLLPFCCRKTWKRSVRRYQHQIFWQKHWTTGIISIAKFISECLAAYVDIVQIRMFVAAKIAANVNITWSLLLDSQWRRIAFLIVLSLKFFGQRVYDLTATLVRSGLPSSDAIWLVLFGLLDTGTIIVNLLNLQTIQQDKMFILYPAVRPMLDVLFAFFMFRVFVLIPGILLGVMWKDSDYDKPTPKTFLHDMIFNNYIVLVFILLGRTNDLAGFRFKKVYHQSKNSVGVLVGFLMLKGLCSLFLCIVAFNLSSDVTEFVPITLTFTVLHMLVSLVQYSCHRCDEDDNDDELLDEGTDNTGSINQGLLRLATPPRQAGPPINRDMCYQVFRFKSWKWRSAVIGILCGMFVFSLSPLIPASLPPAPLPPAPLPPAPAQGACYHVNCGHGICHAISTDYQCICDKNWVGNPLNCTTCVHGHWGRDCSSECIGGATTPCSGFGQCSEGTTGTGKCNCQSGVTGSACNICPTNHFGSHCKRSCLTESTTGTVCSGHGTCDAGTPMSTGNCTCSKGWHGNNCDQLHPGSWMSFRQNAQHQGRATGNKVFDLTRGTAAARWTYGAGGEITSSPAISSDGSTVYVGSEDNKLHAVKTSDGTVLWTYQTGDWVMSSPAISSDGSTVYVGSNDNKLHAVKTSDGTVLWTYKTGNEVRSSPAISSDGSTVYVGSRDNQLHAVKTSDGTVLWTYETGDWVMSSPAISSDGSTVYVGSNDYKLHAVKTSDGTVLWTYEIYVIQGCGDRRETGALVMSSPAISSDGSTVYFGSCDRKLHAVETSDGTVLWTYGAGGVITSSPAISSDGSTVYVGSEDNKLHAVKTSDGTVLWTYQTGDWVMSSPAISSDGSTVYVGSYDTYLHAIKTSDGTVLWTYETDFTVYSSPAISSDGSTIYVGSSDNHLHAIKVITSTTNKICGKQVNGKTRLTAAGTCADCSPGSWASTGASNCQSQPPGGMSGGAIAVLVVLGALLFVGIVMTSIFIRRITNYNEKIRRERNTRGIGGRL